MSEGGGLVSRFREGLARTRQGLAGKVRGVLAGRGAIDEALYEDLEAVLLQADVGVETALKLIDRLRERVRRERPGDPAAVLPLLKEEMAALLGAAAPGQGGAAHVPGLNLAGDKPAVVLVVGVNGAGKTTTAGKLAHRLRGEGKKVLLGAADTFRAAAADQLAVWAERTGSDLIRHGEGADPAAVAFDAVGAGRARGADVVLIDTAGRLHTKDNLMEELKKVHRVAGRDLPGAPHEVLLVLDATTGQNALQQARLFAAAVPLTGIVLTKLDGTAKGGIVLAIRDALGLPVKFAGLGERAEDLRPFDPAAFLDAIFD